MIFGKPDEFAIEAMLETASNSQSDLWGRMTKKGSGQHNDLKL